MKLLRKGWWIGCPSDVLTILNAGEKQMEGFSRNIDIIDSCTTLKPFKEISGDIKRQVELKTE
jgi:hypothetical protein